jgi:trehalose/maltose transport system substrate-binding protein
VVVTFLDVEWDAPDKLTGLAEDLQEFTRETGIEVKRLPRPEGPFNQLALWRELLQGGAATPDVCGIDVIWSGILDSYLLDLKPYFANEISSQYPVVIASYTVGGKVVAIPRHAYVGALLYRPDLLRRYGFHNPPRTWDELQTMARLIQAGERARGKPDFWGYVWQGAAGEGLTSNGLEWQVGDGGGKIIEDDKTISVNNPQVVGAWGRAAGWVGSISPPGVVAYGKSDADNIWFSGKAAFLRAWVSDYSLINSHPPPGDATQFGVTSMPGGQAGRAGTLGGNGLAISQASAHPQEAIELIRFLLQRDARLIRAGGPANPPPELALFELPAILNPYPQAAESNQGGGGIVARPSITSGSKYDEVSKAYIRELHSALTGEKKPSVAAADLEAELIRITGYRKGPPPERDWWPQ